MKPAVMKQHPNVLIKALHPSFGKLVPLPARMTALSAGYDLAAAIDQPIVLQPGERRLVPCGFAMALPPGYEAQIRPRSGLALKHGVTVLNTPGTIDADYRGELKVCLVNLGQEPFCIEAGQRIAQMIIAEFAAPTLEVVEDLDATERGSGGYGSTGHK